LGPVPLTVDGALHDLDGEEVEVSSTPRIISDVGFEQPLRPSLRHKTIRQRNDHHTLLVFNVFLDENHPPSVLILKLSLLRRL
jgi:hypothetical protein